MTFSNSRPHNKILNTTLLLVSLGCFIDAFDAFLYNALRVPSLQELGLSGDVLTKVGLQILSLQLGGLFVGGFLWGILGDKIGRKKALIGSVFLYSIGSLSCAFVHSVHLYAAMRFFVGVGIAGETGLGAILAVETLPDSKRNMALAVFASFSAVAIFASNAAAQFIPWRWCYALGGIGGFLVLVVRSKMFESGLFESLIHQKRQRGSLRLLLQSPVLIKRYLCAIFFTLPHFLLANFLVTLAPEFGRAVGVSVPIKANIALMAFFAGQIISDFMGALVSRVLSRRKAAVVIYNVAALATAMIYLTLDHPSEIAFYTICTIMGLSSYWILALFTAVEQFGTNMRGSLGVSALSAGRASLIIANFLFLSLKGIGIDTLTAAKSITVIASCIGFLCIMGLKETYSQSMDFIEMPKK